jgi:hypothetical protein
VVVIAALLFVLVVGLVAALAGAGVYYVRVLRPRLAAPAASSEPERRVEHDPVAAVVEELNALARLRDQGVLTAREFSTKKGELLQRI